MPKSINVARGLTMKNPEKKVVTRNPIFIIHIFLRDLGHFRLSPTGRALFTSNNLFLCSQSENIGNGHIRHHDRAKTGTRINISITHQSIQTIIIPKL